MNKYNHILTDEEKKIFDNHFIHNGHRGKQDFKEFVNQTISHYLGRPYDLKNNEDRMNARDYAINLIWDEETNTSALMHCFDHPKFSSSNTKFKHYQIFNGDINAVNNNGQSALMFLAKNPSHHYALTGFIEDKEPDNFDLLLVDKDGKSFHMYFFEAFNEDSFDAKKVKKVRHGDIYMQLFSSMDTFKDVLAHWVKSDIPKSQEHILYVTEKTSIVAQGMRNLTQNSEFRKSYNGEGILEEAKKIEAFGNMLHLNATMTVNSQNKRKIKV
jgi:hypothetical protein